MEVLVAIIVILSAGILLEMTGYFGRVQHQVAEGSETGTKRIRPFRPLANRHRRVRPTQIDAEAEAIIGSVLAHLPAPRKPGNVASQVTDREDGGRVVHIELGRFDGNPAAMPFRVRGFNSDRDQIVLAGPGGVQTSELDLSEGPDKSIRLRLRGRTVVVFEKLRGSGSIDAVLVEG